jgi:tRNA dimethylallyltransferase
MSEGETSKRWPILEASAGEMLEKLKEVDPVMAQRWHPNDVRKIRRSLEVWLQTGRKASDVYAEQEARRAGGTTMANGSQHNPGDDKTEGEVPSSTRDSNNEDAESDHPSDQPGLLRFPTLILWPHVPRPILSARLDTRVDRMVEAGLLSEARSLHTSSARIAAETGNPVDETRGIYAAVGYKEFLPYLHALAAQSSTTTNPNIDSDTTSKPNEQHTTNLQALATEATDLTKGATRRYAKSQLRWIRIKLAHALEQANSAAASTPQANTATMYILDASDPSPPRWAETVLKPAVTYTNAFLASTTLPDPQIEAATLGPEFASTLQPLRALEEDRDAGAWQVQTCDVCSVSAAREEEWKRHLASGRHRRALAGKMKREAWESRKAGGAREASVGRQEGDGEQDGEQDGGAGGEKAWCDLN